MSTGPSYIFFDTELRDRFLAGLRARGLCCSTRKDAIDGDVVQVTDEPDDDVLDAIEDEYDALMQEQMLRAEGRADWGSHQVASLQVTLSDGQQVDVRLPPGVARLLLERYRIEEAHELVSAIVHSLANPDDGPLCRRDLLKRKDPDQ